MFKNGYIKLYRKVVDWEWYDDLNTFKLWIHILLKANHDDKKWRGELVKRGSYVSSYQILSVETGLSVQQVRTSINKLLSTGDITKSSRAKNTLFTVPNYELYQNNQQAVEQSNNSKITNKATVKQQSSNKQVTTNNNEKNKKNIKNIKKEINKEKKSYGEFMNVKLTNEEYQKLNDRKLIYMIERLSAYIESSGKTYKSHYATILNWSRKDETEKDNKKLPSWYHDQSSIKIDDEFDEGKLSEKLKKLREEDKQ